MSVQPTSRLDTYHRVHLPLVVSSLFPQVCFEPLTRTSSFAFTMATTLNKRTRGATALRARLQSRLCETPPSLKAAAARFSTTGGDAFLCALGREVADSLQVVQEAAEAARQRLESIRAVFHAAIDARIDKLVAQVRAAESSKAAALERELERLDTVLERTRRDHAAARLVVDGKGDDELFAAAAGLSSRLDDVDALLDALPHGPVEPTLLRLELEEAPLLAALRSVGAVYAPRCVDVRDVGVRGLPASVCPGGQLLFELALCDDSPRYTAEYAVAAIASLSFHTRIAVSLVACTGALRQLKASVVPSLGAGQGVTVTVAIPEDASGDAAEVVVSHVTVAGQAVTRGLSLPLRLRIISDVLSPLLLDGAVNGAVPCSVTPVITASGKIIVPQADCPEVLVFSGNGCRQPPVRLAPLGLSDYSCSAAFVEATGTLLLASRSQHMGASRTQFVPEAPRKIVATEARTGFSSVRWSVTLPVGSCNGIAVLPRHGVFITSDYCLQTLTVRRLVDGSRILGVDAERPSFLAADPATATIFASTNGRLTAFLWDSEDGGSLKVDWVWDLSRGNNRPLTIVPPAPGHRTSYLVVGTRHTSTVDVFALPISNLNDGLGRAAMNCELPGMDVVGLAADASGTALAVCDARSDAVHVVHWPLSGMRCVQ
jgi:hypothetical protein